MAFTTAGCSRRFWTVCNSILLVIFVATTLLRIAIHGFRLQKVSSLSSNADAEEGSNVAWAGGLLRHYATEEALTRTMATKDHGDGTVLQMTDANVHDQRRSGASAAAKTDVNGGGVINFFKDRDRFVEIFAGCIRDPYCRIYYHHVGKTGGATIEKVLYGLFPPFDLDSCCGRRMMDRFELNTDKFCSDKFTSYQVSGGEFQTVVSECMKRNTARDGGSTRAIALTSFREPIQRTLAHIHQMCNKNFDGRSNESKTACSNCSYEKDKDFWDSNMVQMNNKLYADIEKVSKMTISNVDIFTIDLTDVRNFFGELNADLVELQPHLSDSESSDELSRCNFGLKSPMMKGLAPSEAIYRNLILGI